MDSSTIHRQLAQFLVRDLPASIEVIPGSEKQWSGSTATNPHFPFLLLDGNLGIPQSVLYRVYVYATKQLPHLSKSNILHHDHSDLISLTAIVLLANPAHNTALNRRKQLLEFDSPQLTLHHELKFMAALLGMKQASKSSILWHHRRWILRRMCGGTSSPTGSGSNEDGSDTLNHALIPCGILTSEFELASRASEIYPRNYHAWLHRYICVRCLISRALEDTPGALDALRSELKSSRNWVELHASDYTAVQYMTRLVSMLHDSGIDVPFPESSSSASNPPPASTISPFWKRPVLSHALSLVASYPSHESLWLYLRLACAVRPGQSLLLHQWIFDFSLSFLDNPSTDNGAQSYIRPNVLVERILAVTREEDISRVQQCAIHLYIWTLVSIGALHLDDPLIERLRLGSEPLELRYLQGLLDARNLQ